MVKLNYVGTDVDGDYVTRIYEDEDGKRYDFIFEFKYVKTTNDEGFWTEFNGEYEIDE